jgi:hypothetical protein
VRIDEAKPPTCVIADASFKGTSSPHNRLLHSRACSAWHCTRRQRIPQEPQRCWSWKQRGGCRAWAAARAVAAAHGQALRNIFREKHPAPLLRGSTSDAISSNSATAMCPLRSLHSHIPACPGAMDCGGGGHRGARQIRFGHGV